jgi:hypothetical protein
MDEIIIHITQVTGYSFYNVLPNLPFRVYRFLQIYYPTLIFLAIVGILLGRKGLAVNKKGKLFILSFLVFHLVTIAGIGPGSKRYALCMVPLTIFWAGSGFYAIWERLRKYSDRSKMLSYLAIIFIVGSQLPEALKPIQSHREEQKILGSWLRDHTASDSVVAGLRPQEAFYANRQWIPIPRQEKSYQEFVNFLRGKRADYLIADETIGKIVPDFFEMVNQKDLKEVHRIDRKGKLKAIVFEVQSMNRGVSP